ncbi:MAG: HAD-IC family P-type ATPase, partial [Luteococcus japonicus]
KLRIVELLRDRGDVVAVTGDGVNDAPALRAASIGVAMGRSGTDVAREASDVVLTDDNFVTIVDAVEQGRVTFSAIRKATHFLLSSALATMLAVAVNTFTDHPLIFLPVMLLWVNIVMNGLQDVAMSFEPGEGDELRQPPRSREEGILNRTMWVRTVLVGVLMGALTLYVFDHALGQGHSLDHARTWALTTLVMANFFQILSARTERRSAFTINHLRNPLLLGSSAGALVLQWVVMNWQPSADLLGMAPLSSREWLVSASLGTLVLLAVEIDKFVRRRTTPTRRAR